MILKLTDEFLNKHHIKGISEYNSNYYRLPFMINYDGEDYNILRIKCDEETNEYSYSLCYELEYGEVFDNIFIIPSPIIDTYKIDLTEWRKDIGWC